MSTEKSIAPLLIVAALMILQLLAPAAGALHDVERTRSGAQESDPPTGPASSVVEASPNPPHTTPELDQAYQEARDRTRSAIEQVNRTWKQTVPPAVGAANVVPSRIYEDHVEPDPRIGGIGDWSFRQDSAGWERTRIHALEGNWSYAFGNATTGLYDAGSEAYLISPEIDLRQVPAVSTLFNRSGTRDVYQQSDLVTLIISHRFNFLDRIDGGRVEFFTEPPTPGSLSDPEIVQPLGEQKQVSGFGGEFAYTGASGPTTDSYDLTRFLGERLWIAFHVKTSRGIPASLFEDPSLFNQTIPGGWAVDHLEVLGPSYPRNLVVRSFLSPSYEAPNGDTTVLPHENHPVEIRVLNSGARETAARTTLSLVRLDDDGAPEQVRTIGTQTRSMPAGDVEVFRFNWTTPSASGGHVLLTAQVQHAESSQPIDPTNCDPTIADYPTGDNCLSARIQVAKVRHLDMGLSAEPVVAEGDEPVTITANLSNPGNIEEDFDLGWNFTLGPRSVTPDPRPAPEQVDAYIRDTPGPSVTIPAGESRHVSWRVQTSHPGDYRLEVIGNSSRYPDTVFANRSVQFHVGASPPIPCLEAARPDRPRTGTCGDHAWIEPANYDQPAPNGTVDYWRTQTMGAAEKAGSGEWAWLVGRANQSLIDLASQEAQEGLQGFSEDPTDPSWVPARDGLRFEDVKLHLKHQLVYPETLNPSACAKVVVGYGAGQPPVEGLSLPPTVANTDPRPIGNCPSTLAPHLVEAKQFPPPSGKSWIDEAHEHGWREDTISLDRALEILEPTASFWDLSLLDLRLMAQRSPTVPGGRMSLDWFVDSAIVTGVSAKTEERVTLFSTRPGAPDSENVGRWEATGWERIEDESVPQDGQWGIETTEGPEGGPIHVRKADSNGSPPVDAEAALYTPPMQFPEGARPVLELDHRIGTPVRMTASGDDPGNLGLYGIGMVLGQVFEEGAWSKPVRLVPTQPGDAQHYPIPRVILEPEGTPARNLCAQDAFWHGNSVWTMIGPPVVPCHGFFHPTGKVVEESKFDTFVQQDADPAPWRTSVFNLDAQPLDFSGERARFIFLYKTDGDASGADGHAFWEIGRLAMFGAGTIGRDLQVAGIELDVPYNRTQQGLAPGTTVPVKINVTNEGRFPITRALVNVTVQEVVRGRTTDAGEPSLIAEPIEVTRLRPGDTRVVTVDWSVPDGEGRGFRIEGNITIPGLRDDLPADNEAGLSVVTRRVQDIELRAEGFPRVGSSDTPREVPVFLRNVGNVPLSDIRVERGVFLEQGQTGSSMIGSEAWVVQGELEPNGEWVRLDASSLRAMATEDQGEVSRSDFILSLGTQGHFRVRYEATVPGQDLSGDRRQVHEVALKAFPTIASDDVDGEPGGALASGWHSQGTPDTWGKLGPGKDSSLAHRVGGETGYPANANGSLITPPIELSAASGATLTFQHNYTLEEKFDGVGVEASTDGGRTWLRVQPEPRPGAADGYTGTLVPGNALAPPRDAGEQSRAFTGTSGVAGSGPAWVQTTLDLTQLSELRESTTFSNMGLEMLQPSSSPQPRPTGTDGWMWTSPAWDTNDPHNPDPKWKVLNRTYRDIQPVDGDRMLWSDTRNGQPPHDDDPLRHALGVRLDLTSLDAAPTEEHVGLTFWDQRSGTVGSFHNGTGGEFQIRACYEDEMIDEEDLLCNLEPGRCEETEGCILLDTEVLRSSGDWKLRFVDLDQFRNHTIAVGFYYASGSLGGFHPDTDFRYATERGWLIDAIEVFRYDFLRTHPEEPLLWSSGDEDEIEPVPWPQQGWRTFGGTKTGEMDLWEQGWFTLGPQGQERWLPAHRIPWQTEAFEEAGSQTTRWVLPEVPSGADARLVTPVVDLAGLAGSQPSLEITHRYDFPHRYSPNIIREASVTGGTVEVQVQDPTTGEWGPWRQLYDGDPPDRLNLGSISKSLFSEADQRVESTFGYDHLFLGHGTPFDRRPTIYKRGGDLEEASSSYLWTGASDGWRDDTFDLSPFAGKRVRVAFHTWNHTRDLGGCEQAESETEHCPMGPAWEIQEVGVKGEVVRGMPTQLRFRFASDQSGHKGTYAVDNLEIVGGKYARNVVLDVEQDRGSIVEPNTEQTINFSVSNHGTLPRENLLVRLLVEPRAGGSVSFEEAQGVEILDPAGATAAALVEVPRIEPAGSVGASLQLGARLTPTPGEYDLSVEIFERTRSGDIEVVEDEIIGNTHEQLTLKAERTARFRILDVSPEGEIVDKGIPIRFAAEVENVGSSEASARGVWSIQSPKGEGVDLSTNAISLDPGSVGTLQSSMYNPELPGRYTYELRVAGGDIEPTLNGSFVVQPELVQRADTFEQSEQAEQWTARNSGDWHLSTSASNSGETAWHFGPENDAFFNRGESYPQGSNAIVESPVVDFRTAGDGSAFLAFWHRADFETGDGGIVAAVPIDPNTRFPTREWERVEPLDGYPGKTQDPGVTVQGSSDGGTTETCDGTNPLGSVPAFVGQTDGWERRVVNLTSIASETGLVRVRFELGTLACGDATDPPQTGAPARGWFIDDTVFASGLMRIDSPVDQVRIHDGLEKRVFVALANDAKAPNVVQLSINRTQSSFPKGVDDFAQLGTRNLTLGPGSSVPVPIEIETPTGLGFPPSVYHVVLEARSLVEPALSTTKDIEVRFDPIPRADLTLSTRTDSGESSAEEGVPLTIVGTVKNEGLASSIPTTVRATATHLETGERSIVGSAQLPSLEPSSAGDDSTSTEAFTLQWTPPMDRRGDWLLNATVDPQGRVTEFDEVNNRATLPLQVTRLNRPDLRATTTALEARDTAGQIVTAAQEGELVQFDAEIENVGRADAVDVTVKLLLGPLELRERKVGVLAPGDSVSISGNQLVPRGDHELAVVATTTSVELDPGNNQATKPFLVFGKDYTVEAPERALELSPGEVKSIPLKLTNQGGRNATLFPSSQPPAGWLANVEPETLGLDAGEVTTLNLTVAPPSDALAGLQRIPVSVRDPRVGDIPVAAAEIHVEEIVQANVLNLTPPRLTPGQEAATFTLQNTGNAPRTFELDPQEPTGWTVQTPKQITVRPGEDQPFQAEFHIPPTASPGLHKVPLVLRTDDTQVNASLQLKLVSSRSVAFDAETSEQEPPPGSTTFNFTIEASADGNAPATVRPIFGSVPSSWTIERRPSSLSLEPGERGAFDVAVHVPPGSVPGVQRIPVFPLIEEHVPSLSGLQTNPSTMQVRVDQPDLRIVRLESVEGPIFEGDDQRWIVRIENKRGAPSPAAQLKLFVDDQLTRVVPIEPIPEGSTATLNMSVSLPAGEHTMTAALSYPSGARDLSPNDNAIAEVVTVRDTWDKVVNSVPAVGPIGMATLAALLAFVRRRHR